MIQSLIRPNPKSETRYDRQAKLVQEALTSGVPLAAILEREGWSYDDLVYEHSRLLSWNGKPALSLNELRSPKHQVPVVSFFTGAGGMDLGFEAAGYKHTAAFEIAELFSKTVRRNRPNWTVFGPPTHPGDVSDYESITEALGGLISSPFEGVFIGGPPCQPFSVAANQRFAKWGTRFKRTGFSHEEHGSLLFDYVRLVTAFRPRVFVVENVPGLRDLDGGAQLSVALDALRGEGYTVEEPTVLEAADYGVPQQRQRLFVIGSLTGKALNWPAPHPHRVGAGSVLGFESPNAKNNETRIHKAESILRYMQLNYGERDQLGRVDRLNPSLPSKTVIAGGASGGGRSHLHPEIPRTLSVRESARLQTFPDDYVFVGSTARQFTQVGNAVPPVLAAQLARSIYNSYF